MGMEYVAVAQTEKLGNIMYSCGVIKQFTSNRGVTHIDFK